MPKGEINPNPTANWVAETLKEDLADGIREAGGLPDSRLIDEVINEDLRAYEARKREEKPVIRAAHQVAEQEERAAKMAREKGFQFMRGVQQIRQKVAVERSLSPWQRALRARIRELIALALGAAPGQQWRSQDFKYPRFAREFVQEMIAYRTRFGNKYGNLKDIDADKAFSRFCEDLADRSTAVLGQWRKGGV